MKAVTEKNIAPDEELLRLYRQTDNNNYLGILLQRYTVMLFGVCMKYLKQEDEAKDAVQQVFTKVIADIHRHQVTYFKSWLYTVARNHCLMHLRNQHKTLPEEFVNESLPNASHKQWEVNEARDRENTLRTLEEGLETLPQQQKECISLFYLNKKSYKEIAAQTGIDIMLVKSHIQNGKRNLRNYLTKKLNAG